MLVAVLNQFDQLVFTANVRKGTKQIQVAETVDENGVPGTLREFTVSSDPDMMEHTSRIWPDPLLVASKYNGTTFYS